VSSTMHVNICFHGIGVPGRELESGEDQYWIPEAVFEEILDYAAHRPAVRLTFDDGNASDVALALPALRARGLHAEFFPVAGRLGEPGSVDGAGLRELVGHDMTVGTHGMRHVCWRGLDEGDLDDELVAAREIITREIRRPVHTAACPFGSYDRHALRRLRALGYRRVLTSDRRHARSSSWLQARYSVRMGEDVSTVRSIVEGPRSVLTRAVSAARTTAKRCR
jgi:peptidoglycan/xylan/chitin deacetylase (PgdA/CDA1 family)